MDGSPLSKDTNLEVWAKGTNHIKKVTNICNGLLNQHIHLFGTMIELLCAIGPDLDHPVLGSL